MSPSGWVFLMLSWGAILLLTAFCLSRTFKKKA
jgi:hypothetical protein